MHFDVLQPADLAETVSVLGETFAHRDPPAVALELTPLEFEFFVRQYGPKAVDERLTIVARSDNGELAGALLAEDSATAAPESLNQISPKFDPIFDILGQLDSEYRSTRSIQAGEAIHFFLLGVSPRFAGRGVAQGLVSACLTNGMSKGYRLAITEATNKTSQHVFRKLGFVERVTRPYGDHRYNDRAYFDSITGQGGPILMDRALSW